MHVNPNVSDDIASSRSPLPEDVRHAGATLGHAARRLSSRLDAVRVAYDLDRRVLLTSQRFVASRDPQPTVEQFARFVALPMSARLRKRAMAVIDAEFAELCADVVALQRDLALRAPHLDQATRSAEVERALAAIRDAGMDRTPLDELGTLWQRRLRRAAALQALPAVAFAPVRDAGPLVDAAELALVRQAPWAHGDRLLSAFEMAHADVRDHLERTLRRAATTAPGLTGRGLASAAAS